MNLPYPFQTYPILFPGARHELTLYLPYLFFMCAANLPYTFSQLTLSFFRARSELTLSFFQTYPTFFRHARSTYPIFFSACRMELPYLCNVCRVDLPYPFCARGRELPYLLPGVTLSFLTSLVMVAAAGVLCRQDIYCSTENSTGYRAVCGTWVRRAWADVWCRELPYLFSRFRSW